MERFPFWPRIPGTIDDCTQLCPLSSDEGALTNAFIENIVCRAKDIREYSVKELLKESFRYLTSFPENRNYWNTVGRKMNTINVKSDVLHLAANLTQSCLAESEIYGNSILVFGKAFITKVCQSSVQGKYHRQKKFKDLFECLVLQNMTDPSVTDKSC